MKINKQQWSTAGPVIKLCVKIYVSIRTNFSPYFWYCVIIIIILKTLVLRLSASHSPPYSEGNACWMVKLNAAFCLETRARKLLILNISFRRVGIEPITNRVLQSQTDSRLATSSNIALNIFNLHGLILKTFDSL